jgi:predicted dehydrogenase
VAKAGKESGSKPLRVAVIGAGWGGELHQRAYAESPDAEVVAICSRTRSTAEELAAKAGVPGVYTSFDDMASAEELDVISVATPPSSHRQYTIAAAERGYHVLCDKPVALTAADAGAMVQAAEANGVRHATGFLSHQLASLRKLQSLIAEGAIGEVWEVHSRCPLAAPILPMNWMYDADAGGGSLAQHGQHMIEIVRWTLGKEFTAVCGELTHDVKETVVGPKFHNLLEAFGWAMKHKQEGGAEDLPKAEISADTGYAFAASLEGGVRAYFWEAMHSASVYFDQLEVFGSEGTLVWSAGSGLRLVRGRQPPQPIEVEGEAVGQDLSNPEVGHRYWKGLVQAFLDDVRGVEHEQYSTLYDAWKVQEVCDAVHASMESRSWENVPAGVVPAAPAAPS